MRLQLIICHKKELLPSRSSIKLVLIRNKSYQCTGVPKPGGGISPTIIWLYPPNSLSMVYICIPPIIWLWCASERRCPLEFGEKSVPFLVKTFFFFWSSLNLLTWTKSWSRFIPPMLKIGQNWGKVANYPTNAQQRSVPLPVQTGLYRYDEWMVQEINDKNRNVS